MMDKKYTVTEEFMDDLVEWRDDRELDATDAKNPLAYVGTGDINNYVPDVVIEWWMSDESNIERNNRLIAIIQWLNGEDVFDID